MIARNPAALVGLCVVALLGSDFWFRRVDAQGNPRVAVAIATPTNPGPNTTVVVLPSGKTLIATAQVGGATGHAIAVAGDPSTGNCSGTNSQYNNTANPPGPPPPVPSQNNMGSTNQTPQPFGPTPTASSGYGTSSASAHTQGAHAGSAFASGTSNGASPPGSPMQPGGFAAGATSDGAGTSAGASAGSGNASASTIGSSTQPTQIRACTNPPTSPSTPATPPGANRQRLAFSGGGSRTILLQIPNNGLTASTLLALWNRQLAGTGYRVALVGGCYVFSGNSPIAVAWAGWGGTVTQMQMRP